MNSRSKIVLIALLSLMPFSARAGNDTPDLFSTVPAGDITYRQLNQLAQAGLILPKDLAPSLTRFEVAQLIRKAQSKADEIVVAQADEIPPPPADNSSTASSPAPASPATKPQATTPSASNDMELSSPGDVIGANSATEVNAPTTQTNAQEEAARLEAIKSLHSLEDAYQFELKLVKEKVAALKDKVDDADAQQYDLRKRIKGISQFPNIAVYGLGRAFGMAQEYTGSVPGFYVLPGTRSTLAYLDLNPTGTISKEVRWNTILRLSSDLMSNTPGGFTLRRVTMDFNPPWLSAKLGDFDEAYTPLMLWNRDSLDLAYKPEMWARQDDYKKYESFLNNEPYWPLRGFKVGTDIMWPDSQALSELKGSFFAHMIRNGFNDNGGWYLGPNEFTDWIFGGTVKAQSPKWYLGGISTQATVDTYGLIYDEPLDTEAPGSPYNAFSPSTWAHQYILGSVKPDLRVGLGGDFYIGGTMEFAGSKYQDDKQAPNRVFNDFAVLGGAYVQFGNSRITLNYLDVGPYYYSPLAQTRQDAVSNLSGPLASSYLNTPDLFTAPLRNQYFMLSLPRASGIYSFYDRTMDNTFPYGLATPNRHGFGGELDVKALEKNALKVKGAAYFVQEIGGNLVVNGSGTGFIPVDSPTGTAILPIRNFVYVNVGPSFNLGPYLSGFDRDLEIGINFRYENTNSDLGTLTSLWLIGGIRADVLPVWEVSAAYGWQNAKGTEAGYNGTLWARYSYLYDNSDLGAYSPVNINGTNQSIRFANAFKINRNSTVYLDTDLSSGNLISLIPTQGNMNNLFGEVVYEIKF